MSFRHQLLLALFVFISGHLSAQKVQWAGKVLDYSSEFKSPDAPGQYTAKQILGPPANFPEYGFSPCSWAPETSEKNGDEYIQVAYRYPMQVRQIVISENFNPGAIYRVILIDTDKQSHIVYENPVPEKISEQGRLWNLFIEQTPYKVRSVMVVLKTSRVQGYNMIEAIGISDSEDSVKIEVNQAEGLDADIKRENLGSNVNSEAEDLCPVISPDGKTLYFTRTDHPGNMGIPEAQDIWFSTMQADGHFSKAENIGPPLNNKYHNSITSITPDGQTAVLLNIYNADGTMTDGISTTLRDGEKFGFPVKMNIDNFYNRSQFGEYFMSASGKTMIMTIQRDDSEGGKDLYVSFQKEDGSWSEPLNMGKKLNTADNEVSPFLAADEKTLYFSTAGFPGYGSNDMFVSRRQDDSWTNWSEPENLGPGLNTKGWDAYYSIPASGEYAYFVSYENSMGKADIFRAVLPKSVRPEPVVLIHGKVLNGKTNEPLQTKVICESLDENKETGIAHSDPRDGSYSIVLPAGKLFGFLAEKENFYPVSHNLDLAGLEDYEELEVNLLMYPIEIGQTVRLNNVFFDSGKYILRESSRRELDRLVKVLETYTEMKIEIAGHTDDVGDNASNLTLSKNRAKAVLDYLTEKGITAERLTSKGFGETKPIVPNKTEESRQLNRRVEFTIVAK